MFNLPGVPLSIPEAPFGSAPGLKGSREEAKLPLVMTQVPTYIPTLRLPHPGRPSMTTLELDGAARAKRAAGREAARHVRSGMTLGLGTGSTVRFFLEALAESLQEGGIGDVRGVATSVDTEERARELGIPLLELARAGTLDLAVDGADEFTPSLDLIKGLGGALLREKMVVQAARRFIVIADESKAVERLATRAPLPVEVVSFAWEAHLPFFRALGARPERRHGGDDASYLTDNGNPVIDLHFEGGIGDPVELEARLRARAGVVETGLFLRMADAVIVAGRDGGTVQTHTREGSPA